MNKTIQELFDMLTDAKSKDTATLNLVLNLGGVPNHFRLGIIKMWVTINDLPGKAIQ